MSTGHKIAIGRVDKAALAKGKLKLVDTTPAHFRVAKYAKAQRKAAAWLKKGKAR